MWGKLFGSKQIDDVFDKDDGHLAKIGRWIDNRSFTEEEQQKLNMATGAAVRDFAIATLSENTERSKARRSIAVLTIRGFWFLLLLCVFAYPVSPDYSKYVFSLITHQAVAIPVAGVFAFFFGSYAVARNNETKKSPN
jgi:hypothetical protein